MKFKDGTFEFKNGIFISVWQCLTEIFKMKKFNWSTFQFLLVEFENDRAMHNLSLTLGLLCCGIRIVFPTHPKEEHHIHKEVYDTMTKLKESCYGWVSEKDYESFRKKKVSNLSVWTTKKLGGKKKVFIQ
jgi:hypothetical protein